MCPSIELSKKLEGKPPQIQTSLFSSLHLGYDSGMEAAENIESEEVLRDRMLRWFGRHLVALCVTYRHVGEEEVRFSAYSGTLLRVDDTVVWLTAGHCIENLLKALSNSSIEVLQTVLADAFGDAFVSEVPIPIDVKASKKMFVHHDAQGLDYGAIILHPHQLGLLEKNGVRVVAEENWAKQQNVSFFGYMMMGLPEEFTSAMLPDDGKATVSPTMLSFKRLPEPPKGHEKPNPRFVGQVDLSLPLESVVGMSGGPIFGFALKGADLLYWVVAVQSAWLPDTGVTFAGPMLDIGPRLTEWVRAEVSGI